MRSSEHPCPGCRHAVSNAKVACGACWRKVPRELRAAVWSAYANRERKPMAHLRAVGAASGWLRDNPR
jgi:predicted amidophosphoribosyltransferase